MLTNYTERTEFKNTLQVYLEELFRAVQGRKLIILGCRRIAAYICCAIRALGKEVSFFIDPEADPVHMTDEKSFMGRLVFPMHRLIYEDASEIAVIHSLHYRNDLNQVLENYGLKENESYFSLNGYQSAKEYDIFDPLTGFARNEDTGSFHIYGENKENILRIVTIGGATTDYSYSGFRSWPDFLHEMLIENGIPNVVFNGGINGYTSCEERDIVLRDVPCLKPDLVLSLSGECDIGYIMTDRMHPWYSRYSSGKFESILRAHKQDDMRLWFDETGNNLCPVREKSDSQNWLENQQIMYASLKSYGIAFHGFLQPVIFCGNYVMSGFEKKCMDLFMTEGAKEIQTIGLIFDEGKRFYKAVWERMPDYAFLHDLSGVFENVSGVYSDGVHYDEEGNKLIAQAVMKKMIKHEASLLDRYSMNKIRKENEKVFLCLKNAKNGTKK